MNEVLTRVHKISKKEADELIARNDLPEKYECFDKEELFATLESPEATKARVYYGKTEKGELRLVIVGVDDKGKWITDPMEKGSPCPPDCGW